MNKFKKMLSFCLAAVMCLGMAPLSVSAAEEDSPEPLSTLEVV